MEIPIETHPRCFYSCDWGTSTFRLRLASLHDGGILGEVHDAEGVVKMSTGCTAELRAQNFSRHLAAQIENLSGKKGLKGECCVVSGMASSRIGWKELPYARLPQALNGEGLIWNDFEMDSGLQVRLISGICNDEDVLRGEETELVGLAVLVPEILQLDHALVVIPGTHSKHLEIRRGILTTFQTYMTGELFSHIKLLPTLRSCLEMTEPGWDDEWYLRGVEESRNVGLLPALFRVRARFLLHGISGIKADSYLSGLLIGSELSQILAKKIPEVWLVASNAKLAGLYERAGQILRLNSLRLVPAELMERCVVAAHSLFLKR